LTWKHGRNSCSGIEGIGKSLAEAAEIAMLTAAAAAASWDSEVMDAFV